MKIIVKCFVVLSLIIMVAGTVSAQQTITTIEPPIAITDNGDALTECQTITVPASEIITDLGVQVSMTHTWIGDLVVQLNHPDGVTSLTLFSKPGTNTDGGGDSSNLDGALLRFDDGPHEDPEQMGSTIGTTDFVCTTDGLCDYFPNPDTSAIIPSVGVDLSDFNGLDAVGDWTLCAGDTASADTGTLELWTLRVNDPIPVELMSFEVE